MFVPEIIEVKKTFEKLKADKLINEWELPYENILTRRSAAIFFFTPAKESDVPKVQAVLDQYENFSFRQNHEKKLSALEYRVTFSKEEKDKNLSSKILQQ